MFVLFVCYLYDLCLHINHIGHLPRGQISVNLFYGYYKNCRKCGKYNIPVSQHLNGRQKPYSNLNKSFIQRIISHNMELPTRG